MKRVLVINTVGSSIDIGIFIVAFNYMSLSHNRYQYDYVCAMGIADEAKAKLDGIGIRIHYPPVSRLKQPVRYMLWLKKLMSENTYDIMHVHGNSATMFLEIHAAKMAGIIKRICHCHSDTCTYMLVHNVLKRFMLKEMTTAVACSQKAGQWIFGNRFTVLPNGIDSKLFIYNDTVRNEIRSALGIEDKFVIGQAGSLTKLKNYPFSIDLVYALKPRIKNVVLLVVGEGTLFEQLNAKVKSLGLENEVIFMGKSSNIGRFYSAMDCFIFPSISEGFGLVLIEAQASGLSCVASDHVPQITRVSDHTMYLSLEDQHAWVEQITKIADEEIDRKQESQANIEEIIRKGYDMGDTVNRLIELYEVSSERQN